MSRFIHIAVAAALALSIPAVASAGETIHVYGPGGPMPPMKEAATTFGTAHGVTVDVTAGPTPTWIEKAKTDADVIFSGSETMMTDFIGALGDKVDTTTVRPLYLRAAAILVRPGNPGHITGIKDLMKPGHHVLVVNGAGQNGLWEDIVGRTGDVGAIRAFRSNVVTYAANSALARQAWTTDTSLDAWVIWTIWQVSNPTLADQVVIEPEYQVYRDTGVALTKKGAQSADAKAFATYLESPEAALIFARWGWIVPAAH
jgi:accessory colonization factor AcfC